MLKNLKEFSKLKSEWKTHWKNEIVDILLFGSINRGKLNPNDIDICLVFRDKVDLNIVKKVNTLLGESFHVSSLIIDNFFTNYHSLAKTIFFEGKSLITGKSLIESYSMRSQVLYSYDLSKENASKKVQIVYLLRGRNTDEGLVKVWKGEFISNSSFIVPLESDSEIIEVLDKWKVKYKRKKLLLIN